MIRTSLPALGHDIDGVAGVLGVATEDGLCRLPSNNLLATAVAPREAIDSAVDDLARDALVIQDMDSDQHAVTEVAKGY